MYNKAQRNKEYINQLKLFLEDRFAIQIDSISEAKRGFYGETWSVDTQEKGKLFVKIDYCEGHQPKYINSFAAIERINQSGINYITKLVKTRDGKNYDVFMDGIVSVAHYIEGENREDYPISQLFNHLAPIYKTDMTGLEGEIEVEKFSKYYKDNVYIRMDYIQGLGKSKSIKKLNEWYEEKFLAIDYRGRRLDLFASRCRENTGNMYVTHGDAGGNVIIDGDNFNIIDWDYTMISPIERDVWFFMCDEKNIDMINGILKQHNVDYTINRDRLAYYCYMTFFYYMTEYLQCIIDFLHNEEIVKHLVDDIIAYFDGWISQQIKYADKKYK